MLSNDGNDPMLNEQNEQNLFCNDHKEKSYDIVDDRLAPMPNSQDYLCHDLADEIEAVSSLTFVNGNQLIIKNEPNDFYPDDRNFKSNVVLNDYMFGANNNTQLQPIIFIEDDEDSIDNCGVEPQKLNTKPIFDKPLNDSKYSNIEMTANIQTSDATVLEKQSTRQQLLRKALPPLKVWDSQSQPTNAFINQNNQTISTPQITNDVLDMEKDFDQRNFDLVSFIDQDQVRRKQKNI